METLTASLKTYRALMETGTAYIVPKFQQDYVWDLDLWDEIWQDLQIMRGSKDAARYMGQIVLHSADNSAFTVVDGHQRLITFTLLVLSVLNAIKKLETQGSQVEENKKRRAELTALLIGPVDEQTGLPKPRLRLSRSNEKFFSTYLAPLAPAPETGLNASDALMERCFTWFGEKVEGEFHTGSDLAGFLDLVTGRFFFSVLSAPDEAGAFRVFESTGPRSARKSMAEMLRNALFSVVDGSQPVAAELREAEALWNRVTDSLGPEQLPEFLRAYWNSRNKLVRRPDLLKALRSGLKSKADVFAFLRELNGAAHVYKALLDPAHELWDDRPAARPFLEELRLFRVGQSIPVLLSGYRSLPPQRFEQLVRHCAAVTFRYNVIGSLNPNEQEKTFNVIALGIQRDKSFAPMDFHAIFPGDDEFETGFKKKEFTPSAANHAIVRYIFGRIEQHTHQREIDPMSDSYSVEHVLPENPPADWGPVSPEEFHRIVYRLGNLVLIETSLAQSIQNVPFAKKKPRYGESAVDSTKAIAGDFPEWNEGIVNARQAWMARQARVIWRL